MMSSHREIHSPTIYGQDERDGGAHIYGTSLNVTKNKRKVIFN